MEQNLRRWSQYAARPPKPNPRRTTSNYIGQWWDNVSSEASATPVPVGTGVTTPNIDAAMVTGGQISGHVTVASTGADLANICVIAAVVGIPSPQPGWLGGATVTGSDGTYIIMGLDPANTYDVSFDSLGFGPGGCTNSNYVDQPWPTAVSVTTGGTSTGIDAAMAVGGQISGHVTAAAAPGGDLAGICVTAYIAGGTGTWVRMAIATDSTGAYTLTGLDPA